MNGKHENWKFVVGSIRKKDGAVFFPEGRLGQKRYFDNFDDALEEAERKAKSNSADYRYVVFGVIEAVSVSLREPIVEITWTIDPERP